MVELLRNHRTVDGIRIHYESAGPANAAPVLLLHGWPTNKRLWRGCMVPLAAAGRRPIAVDLPGFGDSDKPPDASYSFPFFARVLDGLLERLDIERTGLAVHDLGGPIGLYWAACNPDRVTELALLNTLVFPNVSWAVKAFVLATILPGVRHALASQAGIRFAMRLGTSAKQWTAEDFEPYLRPYRSRLARRALLKAGHGLHPGGFRKITGALPGFRIPVRIVYGERDRILPDVGKTMARVAELIPNAETTALPECGHFLQEDAPDRVGGLLADFFGRTS